MSVSSSKVARIAPKTAPYPTLPVRQYSFTDHAVHNPVEPPPGDRLDREHDRSNAAIAQIIAWSGTSLNTDGTLRAGSVGKSQITPGLFDTISSDAKAEVQPLVDLAYIYNKSTSDLAAQVAKSIAAIHSAGSAAASAAISARSANALAQVASDVARVAAQQAEEIATLITNDERTTAGDVAICTDYANVCMAWAEYMPSTIPPNILAVMGVTGDHWSSRWWANQASQTVSTALDDLNQALDDALGQINDAGDYWLGVLQDQTENAIQGIQSLYLGAFYAPPVADSLGNPIATGAMYFDLTLDAAYVWNGATWRPLVTPGPSALFRYIYVATANQTIFAGADRSGNVFKYNHANYQTLEVFKAGVLLTPVTDYTEGIDTVTLAVPVTAGVIVQLIVASIPQVALNWQTLRLDTSAWTSTGGVLINIANGTAVTPQAASDVMVSVDGVWQSGGRDYTIAGNLLTFTTPTQVNAKTFGLVIVPIQAPTVPTPALTVLITSSWVFDGVSTTFPLRDGNSNPVSPVAAVNLLVSLNGVWQAAITDYTVAGSNVTFTTAPQTGSVAFAVSGLPN